MLNIFNKIKNHNTIKTLKAQNNNKNYVGSIQYSSSRIEKYQPPSQKILFKNRKVLLIFKKLLLKNKDYADTCEKKKKHGVDKVTT